MLFYVQKDYLNKMVSQKSCSDVSISNEGYKR